MELRDKVIVITGAASGIGAALAERFEAESPKAIIRVDLAGTDWTVDVSDADAVTRLIAEVEDRHGPIDLYCSNAGIATGAGVEDATPQQWQRIWEVNVMAAVHAAKALLPGVRVRGEGYLLITASAAGLLTNLGDAPYTVTKHASVGLAEWLAITHGDDGLKVSCLCPQGVRTPMVMAGLEAEQMAAGVVEFMGLIEPEAVAESVVEGLRAERFLILPHPEVADYQRNKAAEPDRWIGGMRKLQRRLSGR